MYACGLKMNFIEKALYHIICHFIDLDERNIFLSPFFKTCEHTTKCISSIIELSMQFLVSFQGQHRSMLVDYLHSSPPSGQEEMSDGMFFFKNP